MASPLLLGSSPLWTAAPFQLPLFFTGSRTELTWLPDFLPYNSSARTTVENAIPNNTSIVACVSVAAGMCLPSCCLETNVVSEPFANNGCFCDSTVLDLNKYATILYLFTRKEHWWDDCISSSSFWILRVWQLSQYWRLPSELKPLSLCLLFIWSKLQEPNSHL
jgi:hypothetical protein